MRDRWTPWILAALVAAVFAPGVLALPPDAALSGGDVTGWFHPTLAYFMEGLRAGAPPLWNPHMFAGYPLVANPQVGMFYPPNWLLFAGGVPLGAGLALGMAAHLWLGGWGMARLVHGFGATGAGALLSGVVFMFSQFMFARVWVGHYSLLAMACWTPWALVAYRWAVRRGSAAAALLAGGVLGMMFIDMHPLVMYAGLALAGVWLYEMAARRAWRLPTRQLALMGTMGAALSAVQLLPFVEFTLLTERAAGTTLEFAGTYAMPAAQLITAAVPDLFGSPALGNYWGGKNFQELTFYAGLLPLFGVAFALRRQRAEALLFLGWAGFGAVMSLGAAGGLYALLYEWVPLFSLARAPGRGSFLVVLGGAGLAGLLLSWLQRAGPGERRREARLWTRAGAGGAALLFALSVVASPILKEANTAKPQHASHAFASAALAMLAWAAVFWLWRRGPGRLVLVLTLGLALLDLWRVDLPLLREHSLAPPTIWQAMRVVIGPGGDPTYRVWPESATHEEHGAGILLGYYNVDGDDPMKLAAYSRLFYASPDPRARTFDLFNLRYAARMVPPDRARADGWEAMKLVAQHRGWYIYERPGTQPRTFLAERVQVIPDDAEAIDHILNAPDFDPASDAILERAPPCDIGGAGEAEIAAYGANTVTLEVEAGADALLVLTDAHYPGWNAYIDGQRVEVLRADVAFRAVCVPAGTHRVTMRFEPVAPIIGGAVTLAALGVLALAGIRERRKRQ